MSTDNTTKTNSSDANTNLNSANTASSNASSRTNTSDNTTTNPNFISDEENERNCAEYTKKMTIINAYDNLRDSYLGEKVAQDIVHYHHDHCKMNSAASGPLMLSSLFFKNRFAIGGLALSGIGFAVNAAIHNSEANIAEEHKYEFKRAKNESITMVERLERYNLLETNGKVYGINEAKIADTRFTIWKGKDWAVKKIDKLPGAFPPFYRYTHLLNLNDEMSYLGKDEPMFLSLITDDRREAEQHDYIFPRMPDRNYNDAEFECYEVGPFKKDVDRLFADGKCKRE